MDWEFYYIYLLSYCNITLTPVYLLLQVNTAARMETTSILGRVQLSGAAADLLRRNMPPDLALEPRGNIAVKGKVRQWLNFEEGWDVRSCMGRLSTGRDPLLHKSVRTLLLQR